MRFTQCHRYQNYGHTRTYSNRKPRCVRCGQEHLSDMCQKSKDQPDTWTLCGESNPASYKGCTVHKLLQKNRNTNHRHENYKKKSFNHDNHPHQYNNDQNSTTNFVNGKPLSIPPHSCSYSNVVKSPKHPPNPESNESSLSSQFSSFLEQFQSNIIPLINLLTTSY